MKLLKTCVLGLSVLLGAVATLNANEGSLAFVGATIIDGTDNAPLENATLLITDGRVRAIGPSQTVTIPDGARLINVAGRTIIPGLINAHGHVGDTLGLEGGHYNRDNLLRQLRLYARYGITTVFSLGGDAEAGFALRNEQHVPTLDRARLYVAGSVVSGDTELEIRRQVNENADLGADFIKVRVDDNLGRTRKMSRELFDALVDQAEQRRLPVAVHLYYLDDARYALEAGADLIAHSIRDAAVGAEFMDQMQTTQVCYVPTLTREVSTFVYESEPDFFADPFFRREVDDQIVAELLSPERMSRVRNSESAQAYKAGLEVAMDNLGALHAAGIPVAMGTDSGPPARFQGYFEHLELSMMVDAGMSPLAAIRAATGVAAQCMGENNIIGTLEPGNWGDLVILRDNPANDITNTRSIESVWIAGNEVPRN